MKKAMEEIAVPSLGCFAHTLQLIVHEGLLVQRSVSDAMQGRLWGTLKMYNSHSLAWKTFKLSCNGPQIVYAKMFRQDGTAPSV